MAWQDRHSILTDTQVETYVRSATFGIKYLIINILLIKKQSNALAAIVKRMAVRAIPTGLERTVVFFIFLLPKP